MIIWMGGPNDNASVDPFCFLPRDLTDDVKWSAAQMVLLGPWPLWCRLCRLGDWI
jgi:hypothetical protein